MTRLVGTFARVMLFTGILSCDAADLYHLGGIVVDTETGSPLPRARVVVLRTGTTQVVARQTTGADGKFGFDLPPGKFNLQAGIRDLVQAYGVRAPDSRVGTSIITGPDQDTSNLIFRWFPPGAISGKVLDEAGEPVESALVQLLRSTVVNGHRVVNTSGWVRTDDRGEYRFGSLSGGSFFLAVTGTPWYSSRGVYDVQASHPPLAYNPVYFPSTSDLSSAAPLMLKPGQEAHADFRLAIVSGATLSVKHDAPREMRGSIGLMTEGIGGRDGFQRQDSFTGGLPVHTFASVPPGRYLVRVTGTLGTSDFSARRSIDVNGSDVTIELDVRPVPAVSGTVKLKNAAAKPGRTLLASLVREDTGAAISTVVRADGSFVFPSVAVAKYRPAIRGMDGYFASEIHVEGAEFHAGVVDLVEGESVTIRMVASDEIGRLQGFVMRGDVAIEGVMVVLAPADASTDQLRYRGFQTDSDGSFDFQNVPAGDYLLLAVEDTGLEYANPSAMRPYLSKAKPVHIEAHCVYSERIPLVMSTVENHR
jgi:hypothetical protein